MNPKYYRVLYALLLILACIIRHYELRSPSDGGTPGPGDGLILLLDPIPATLLALPLLILFWRRGFKSERFRKSILICGFIIIEWPLFGLLAIYLYFRH
jgi:hypothetical protein